MEESTERYRITVGDGGLEICGNKGKRFIFSATEALMLLDILKNGSEPPRQIVLNTELVIRNSCGALA